MRIPRGYEEVKINKMDTDSLLLSFLGVCIPVVVLVIAYYNTVVIEYLANMVIIILFFSMLFCTYKVIEILFDYRKRVYSHTELRKVEKEK